MEDSKFIMFNIPLIQKYLNCGYPHAAKIFDFLIEENDFKTQTKDGFQYYLLPKEQEDFLHNAIYLYHKKLTEEEYYETQSLNKIDYKQFTIKNIKWRFFKNNNLKQLLKNKEYNQNTKPYLFPISKENKEISFYDLNKDGSLYVCYNNKAKYNLFMQSAISSVVSKFSYFDIQFMMLTKEDNLVLSEFGNLKHLQNKISDKKLENVLYLKYIEHIYEKRKEEFVDKDVSSIEEHNTSRFVTNYNKKRMPYIVLIIEDIDRFLQSEDKMLRESLLNILNYNKKFGIYSIASSKNVECANVGNYNSVLFLDKEKSFKLFNETTKQTKVLQPFLIDKKDVKEIIKHTLKNN